MTTKTPIEAYLPQNVIENSLTNHSLIKNERLNFKEVYKVMVQLLALKQENVDENCLGANVHNCSNCASLGIQNVMIYNDAEEVYVCDICSAVENEEAISSSSGDEKKFSPRWWPILKSWIIHISNDKTEDHNLQSANDLIHKFSKYKQRVSSLQNLVAAVLLIVERPTILQDEKVGPIKKIHNYCLDCGEFCARPSTHICSIQIDID